ncbi:glycoside hydrolase family 15 [Anoxybacter fermentans]|uniref:Glycoside hydrolase family 15 n=1 Tax=Anoxybacter fermentans TaxID=1323375 RepID=A0A3S9SVF7_9FIRM|nr:glycoside hydrolase family 15 protein [Anoxybacter fermentans]AZR72252.1 glycoside hydrolase family 15 [Anoxybacter fermentans]
MPRALTIGNGNLLINFDKDLNMRDLYFPHVGELNHIGGHKNSLGVWVDGQFSWTDEYGWQNKVGYLKESLVTKANARHDGLGVELEINDLVHFRENIYLKKIKVKNLFDWEREIRIFLTHDFSINETNIGDTVFYDPSLDVIIQYKRDICFLINGFTETGDGFFQYACGIKRFGGAEGTWRDAEDGWLEGNTIAQGSVDSTISFRVNVPGKDEEVIYYWIVVDRGFEEVREMNSYVLSRGPANLLQKTEAYWRAWVNKTKKGFHNLSSEIVDLYKLSLLIVRTQIDNNGAIIAANDSDILQYNRDHYSYMWPRDGALVAYALDMAGYPEITSRFFRFCEKVLAEGGYVWHKYNPDGSVGSSWHPWFYNGEIQLPIQEDETALILFALWHFYEWFHDLEFVESLYQPLIKKAADFMVDYRHPGLKLPLMSYDLWEERRGIFTFTAASVYGGLIAAANFAKLLGDLKRYNRYAQAASEVKEAILTHLYDQKLGRFIRGIYLEGDNIRRDLTLESSLYGVFKFGVLPAKDPKMVQTMQAIENGLWCKTEVGGIARYTNDYYFKKSEDIANVPGNPWFICTMWLADWYIEIAETYEDLEKPLKILYWVVDHQCESGVLSEQIHPYTGEPLSVAPLTWSHATLIMVVNNYLKKYAEINQKCFMKV